ALASDRSDSAQIINAVARVSIKSGNQAQAEEYYQKLLSYNKQTDRYGFPYINYAVSQLLNLQDQSKNVNLVQDLENVILKMSEGEIPLTLDTKELLDQITGWISSRETTENINKAQIRGNINELQDQLWFIRSYSEMITEQLNQGILDNGVLINSFTPVSTVMDGNNTLLFIKPEINGPHRVGFLINQEKLLLDIVDGNWRSEFEFDYNIYFKNSEPYPSELEGRQISYSKIFSFPSSENIIVELSDPNVITAYVLRTTWIYGIALVLLSGAIVLGVFLVIKDFTRERHMSQMRSDFVSSVTHELKTPLTSIHMFAESILMNRVKNAKDRREYLQIIMNETARLKRLINNVLDFSKLEEGKIQLHLRELDLSKLVESAVKDLDYWIREKNSKINKHIEKGIYANVDEDALIQAIINLLSNAIRYSGDKQEIWLRMSQNEEFILIEVEDQGVGISKDQQKKIFEKFYRIDKGDKPGVTGTGLGLTVTKEIVEAHGGTITVKSTINRGSTFTIQFNKSKMV
ncbi:MAG: HAMP domain-containing sensor histidine kinase, partial [Candidatus Neomarinimicrobiota bacterium]